MWVGRGWDVSCCKFIDGKCVSERDMMDYWLMIFDGSLFFFFQAEDGIRDTSVTGVQTCALPI